MLIIWQQFGSNRHCERATHEPVLRLEIKPVYPRQLFIPVLSYFIEDIVHKLAGILMKIKECNQF
jgi:hypothetical protein